MIKLFKTKLLEVVLRVEVESIAAIRDEMNDLLQSGAVIDLECVYDASIFDRDKCELNGKILINLQEDEALSKTEKGISLVLDSDSIELILTFLGKHERGEAFMPEICELPVKGSKNEVTLVLDV